MSRRRRFHLRDRAPCVAEPTRELHPLAVARGLAHGGAQVGLGLVQTHPLGIEALLLRGPFVRQGFSTPTICPGQECTGGGTVSYDK